MHNTIKKILGLNKNHTIIEVGANLGNDTARLAADGSVVYAFEPTRELLVKLWSRFEKNKNIRILPFAVDSENGYKKFNIAGQADWGCSSFYEFADNIEKKWPDRPDFKFTHSYEVPTITLFDFCTLYKIEKIDYLWIDTQGNDFNVLKSLKSKINIVKAGKCEVANTVELYKDIDNSLETVKSWLLENNFEVTVEKMEEKNREVDLHFIRKNL